MKGIILSLVVFTITICTVIAGNDKPITVEQLPATAKKFINNHFPNAKISFVKKESDFFDKSYEVIFTDGNKLDFNSKGEWTEVECKFTQVPDSIVPEQIKNYVTSNYNETKIVAIDRDRRAYEVKLANGIELKFNKKFKLIDLDN